MNGCGRIASHLSSRAWIWAGPSESQIACSAAEVVDRGERVVHRGEPDPGLGGLALGPVVPVEAQLGVVGEVGAELDEERAEVGVEAVEVEVVDHPGGLHDPRIGHPSALRRFSVRNSVVFSCARPMNTTPSSPAVNGLELLVHHVVLALTLDEVDPRDVVRPWRSGGSARTNRSVIAASGAVEAIGSPSAAGRSRPGRRVLQPRLVHVAVHPVDALHLED